jgi:hypothetical protein
VVFVDYKKYDAFYCLCPQCCSDVVFNTSEVRTHDPDQ